MRENPTGRRPSHYGRRGVILPLLAPCSALQLKRGQVLPRI